MQSKLTLQKRKVLSKPMIIVLIIALLLFITVVITGLVLLTQQYELVRLRQTSTAIALAPALIPSVIPTETLLVKPSAAPTSIPSQTATEFAFSTFSIGQSMDGRQIGVVCMGSGSHKLVIIAGIHGDESLPREFIRQVSVFFQNNPQAVPADVEICVIENMNPDGAAIVPAQRFNANYVDLNRNWDTSDWVSDINRGNGILTGGGGDAPLSEPENRAVANFLFERQSLAQHPVIVFFYHSTIQQFSDVRPGYTIMNGAINWGPLASMVARQFAAQVNYEYLHAYEYPITGESLHWMAAQGFVGVGVEMPDAGIYTEATLSAHVEAFQYLMDNWPE